MAVAHCEGAAVVYHAPKACAHITEEMERNRHFRVLVRGEYTPDLYVAPLITSDMGRKESIFGGSELLRDCLAYVAEQYKPRYIVATNSCVAGVIGDDTASVCEEMEKSLGVPIIHVDCHGFLDGEYYGGYIEASKKLIQRFMKAVPHRETNSVTLLGEKDGPASLAVRDFCNLLKDFGVTIYKRFPGYCSLEEMEDIGKSSFTIILGGSRKAYSHLRELADFMEEQLGIPHFEADYPVGWKATCEWVEKLGAFMKQPEKVEPSKARLWSELMNGYEVYKPILIKQELVLCMGKGYDEFGPDWLFEWMKLGELSLKRVVFLDHVSEAERKDSEMRIRSYYPKVDFEVESESTQLSATELILTTHELAEPNLRQFLLPMLPPVGTAGLLQMYKKLFMLARRSEERGVVLYGW